MAYLFKYYAGVYDRFMKVFKLDQNTKIIACMGTIKGKKILDVGGGTGTLADVLQQIGGVVTLVDPSKEMTRVAHKKNPQVCICNQTLEALEGVLEVGTFDCVVIRDALHHMPYPQETLALCRRYLKSGGQIIILDFDCMAYKAKLIRWFEFFCFERCHKFSKQSLKAMCENYFETEDLINISSYELLYKGIKRS